MSFQEIKELLLGNGGFWFVVIFIVLSMVQIAPIKINPWSWIAQKIGCAINKDVVDKVNDLKQEVNDVKKDIFNFKEELERRNADACRTRILRFGDEILHGVPHSKEHYDNILIQISLYEIYCRNHSNYMNNVAVETIKHIKHMYRKHLEEDSFLK